MNILQEIADSPLYTLHSHTQFCDGRASMEDFARAAAEANFAVYGFTPHSPIPFPSPCNMAAADVPAYLAEVERIKTLFPQVRFFAGMEIDYLGPQWGAANEYFRNLPLDFRISSIHFIPTQEGEMVDVDGHFDSFQKKMEEKFHGDIRYVVDTFFAHSQQMLAEGGFDIIGHFDKIKHNAGLYHPGLEDEPWYQDNANSLIDSIISKGVIVEINTKAWKQHSQLFPAQRHWKRLLAAGVPIVVNSDVHYPDLINAARPEVMAALNYLKNQIK